MGGAPSFAVGAFGRYAGVYDLFYRDRDYDGETGFVRRKIEEHAPRARTILDVGCGTGTHARALAAAGYEVRAVDVSPAMIEQALSHPFGCSPGSRGVGERLRFSVADVRDMDMGAKFDVVTALFHVMSYQATLADFEQAVSTIRRHQDSGGLFLFDFWFGPRVLSNEPGLREKRSAHGGLTATRTAVPRHLADQHLVEVAYAVRIERDAGSREEFRELHRLRYFFEPELARVLECRGYHVLELAAWPRTDETSFWYYLLARAT